MDGNGRWARARGLPRSMGHRRGVEAVRAAVRAAGELGIEYLTLFAFSSENWRRPKDEVEELLGLLRHFIRRDLADLHKEGVRVRVIGARDDLSADIRSLLEEADRVARGEDDAIRQVTARYADSRRLIQVANSDGLLTGDDQVRTSFSVSCVAVGDGGMQTGRESVGHTVGFELFDRVDVADLARRAARRAVTKLDAVPAPSGEMPVVVGPGGGGVLFHEACGHGLEADLVAKSASVFAGRRGEVVAAPFVTLVDDGTMAGEWGFYAIDDEGQPAGRNVLIEDGVLTDYMWDRLRARKEGRDSTGNGRRQSYQHLPMVRMTNTFLAAGDADPDEILADTERGVYVAQLGGGQVNTATGDFVFGMTEAYLIENGRITAPIREGNLIGNGPDVLRDIDVIAGDFAMGSPGTCGKDGQGVPVGDGTPTLRVTRLTVGGTAA